MDIAYSQWCLHEDFQEWVNRSLGHEIWTPLYNPGGNNYFHGGETRFIWSFLLNLNSVEDELNEYTFHQFDGYPYTDHFVENDRTFFYSRFLYQDREPIIFRRSFPTKEGYLEFSQEFIHFFELYNDIQKNQFILEHGDGREEVVVKFTEDGGISVKTHRVKQFLAFKEMALVVGFSNQRHFNDPIGEAYSPSRGARVLINRNSHLNYALWYQDGIKTAFLSELLGKKIIKGMPIENTGIRPFEKEAEYETFIVGFDEHNNPIEYSCNPNILANYFGANPDAPHYLTPVFFSKDVLNKYYSDPSKYKVDDGGISVGSLHLRADTNHVDHIVVFLGDLGRDIPFSEQKYWKSFNIMPSGEMSSTAIRRAFLGEFSDPEIEHFVFRQRYHQLQFGWKKHFGWDLIKLLNDADEYRLSNIRIPITENQQEFDQMVENLTIILVESLNDNKLKEILVKAGLSNELKQKRSISKLNLFFENKDYKSYEQHIEFLQDLYWLRTHGASHRKGSNEYEEVRKQFQIKQRGYNAIFRDLLISAIEFLEFLLHIIDADKKV
ncbi:MAG: hypothetical protein WBF08_02900 [Candidatus Bathyarchaeia archaeon]